MKVPLVAPFAPFTAFVPDFAETFDAVAAAWDLVFAVFNGVLAADRDVAVFAETPVFDEVPALADGRAVAATFDTLAAPFTTSVFDTRDVTAFLRPAFLTGEVREVFADPVLADLVLANPVLANPVLIWAVFKDPVLALAAFDLDGIFGALPWLTRVGNGSVGTHIPKSTRLSACGTKRRTIEPQRTTARPMNQTGKEPAAGTPRGED